MYFDPTWIFDEKPPAKQYPNITGLMPPDGKPKKQRKPVMNSLADVFSPVEPVAKMQPITTTQIPQQDTAPDRLRRVKVEERNAGNIYPNGFRDEYRQIIGDKSNQYQGLVASGDMKNGVRLVDNKYNIRNNLWVDKSIVNEIQKVAQAGNLTPEQTLLLAAISSNEDEFGQTRNLFGINDLYNEFGDPTTLQPDSYEANQYRKNYSGNLYQDLAGYVKRKTDNFNNLENWNSRFAIDKKINPRGETYTDRIMRNADILMSNPEFLKALFNGQVPQFNFTKTAPIQQKLSSRSNVDGGDTPAEGGAVNQEYLQSLINNKVLKKVGKKYVFNEDYDNFINPTHQFDKEQQFVSSWLTTPEAVQRFEKNASTKPFISEFPKYQLSLADILNSRTNKREWAKDKLDEASDNTISTIPIDLKGVFNTVYNSGSKIFPSNDAYYNPNNKTAGSWWGKKADMVHEFTHGSGVAGYFYDYINSVLDKDTKFKGLPEEDFKGYISDPREIYSRIMEIRYNSKLIPGDVIEPHRLKEIKKENADNDLFYYLDDSSILELLNGLSMNEKNSQNNNYEFKA